EVRGASHQRLAPILGLLLGLAFLDPPAELVAPGVDSDALRLGPADLHAAEAGVVERLLGHHDAVGRALALGQREFPLVPQLGEMVAPGFLEAAEEEVGPAQ